MDALLSSPLHDGAPMSDNQITATAIRTFNQFLPISVCMFVVS
jgi:hypothetical protein